MSFEWQTIDEEGDERWPEGSERGKSDRFSRRRRWLAILLVLALMGTAAIYLYREGQQRIEASAARLEADVLSSHQLGHTALQQQDLELFSAILSGRLPAWTEAQKELLEAGVVYEQTARVLELEPVGEPSQSPEISFDSELREATLTAPWDYRLPGGSVTETVTLTQTAVYRRGTDRWLLSPPASDDFWGSWRTRERQFVAVTYPVRDESVSLKLARDLDRKVAEMCERVTCPAGYAVRIRLERTPRSLLPLLDPEQRLIGRQTVILPTPTLVGLPADEAAYEALFRGYARHLLSALLVDLREWNCCEHTLFHQALLYRQLAALEVAPEPFGELASLYVPDRIPDRQQLLRWWREDDPVAGPDEIPGSVYLFLDFVRAHADTGGDVFSFRSFAEPVLDNWLEENNTFSQFDWEAEWPAYVRRQAMQAQAELPTPAGLSWPEQELVAVCQEAESGPDGARSVLVRYDPVAQSWSEAMELASGFVLLTPLRDDDGFFLTHQHPFQEAEGLRMDTYLYRAGQPPILVAGGEGSDEGMAPFSWWRPGGEELAAWTFAPGEEGLDSAYALVVPDECTTDGCPLEELPGLPFWSPDGQQMLATSFDNSQQILRRTSEDRWVEVGTGIFPFWIDDETYAIIGENQPEEGHLSLGKVGEDQPEPWLSEEMLAEALPEGHSRFSFAILSGFAHPLAEGKFLLLGSTNQGAELFEVGREPAGVGWLESRPLVRHLASTPGQPTRSLVDNIVEPGRPWLVLPLDRDGAGLWLFSLATEETLLSPRQSPASLQQGFDWSADGVWLARPAGGALDLIALDQEINGRPYRRFVFHDYGYCSAVAWVNRN